MDLSGFKEAVFSPPPECELIPWHGWPGLQDSKHNEHVQQIMSAWNSSPQSVARMAGSPAAGFEEGRNEAHQGPSAGLGSHSELASLRSADAGGGGAQRKRQCFSAGCSWVAAGADWAGHWSGWFCGTRSCLVMAWLGVSIAENALPQMTER